MTRIRRALPSWLVTLICGLTAALTLATSPGSWAAGYALDFDGTDDRLAFGSAPALGASAFTIELWFIREGAGVSTSTGTGGIDAIPLVAKGRGEADGNNKDMNYFLGIRASDSVLAADFEEGSGGSSPGLNHPVVGVTPIITNTWYHAAVSYDGNKWQLYLNGVLETELVVGQPPRSDSIQHASVGSALNSLGTAAGFFNGIADEVRIWNYARSGSQIQSNKCYEISSAAGLIGRWGLNEGVGSSTADSSGSGVTGALVNGPLWATGASFSGAAYEPVARIVTPTNNTPVNPGGAVVVNVNASDSDGAVAKVEFFCADAKLGEDTTPPFAFAWNNIPIGCHAVSAIATDNSGMAKMADPVFVVAAANPTPVFGFTKVWRYNQTDQFTDSVWKGSGYTDSAWPQGGGLLYVESSALPEPKTTPLTLNSRWTFYFRTHFTFSGNPATDALRFRCLIDDGAVFYLNGNEIQRVGMAGGTVTYTTPASRTVDNATTYDEFTLLNPPGLQVGDNVLAVEVHQINTSSSDVVFGCSLEMTSPDMLTRGPYLQKSTPSSFVVRWRTAGLTDSRVRYGTAVNSLNNVVDITTPTAEHEVTVSGLSANTKYYYSFGTVAGAPTTGDANQFCVTHPTPGTVKPTRIWVLGDSGSASAGGGANQTAVRNAYYNYQPATPTDLWLMLGDNAYNDGTDAEFQTAVFDMYTAMLKKSVLWPTRGNHERTDANGSVYYANFTMPASGEAGGVASGTEKYYSFDYANIHFICLDSEGSTPVNSAERSATSPMAIWLKSDLTATTAKWVIVFWHSPPYTKGSGHDSDSSNDSGGRMIDMRSNIVPILEDHDVDLVLCGHSHSYERSYLIANHYGLSGTWNPATMLKDGGDGRLAGNGPYLKSLSEPMARKGTVYAVPGSSGWVGSGSFNHPAMFNFGSAGSPVRGLAVYGSVVLDVNGDQLDVKLLQSNGAIGDNFTMRKRDLDTFADMVYGRFYGGNGTEYGYGWQTSTLAVDSGGNTYLVGDTTSTDLFGPLNAWRDAFVAKFDASGQLVWQAHYGTAVETHANAVAVSPVDGSVWIVGKTWGAGFPTTGSERTGFDTTPGASYSDSYVVKFTASGSFAWGTYLGGNGSDVALGINFDSSGNAFVVGNTYSTDFPTTSGLDTSLGGESDGFVVKIAANGNFGWGTYFGGTTDTDEEMDWISAVATDAGGNVYVAGVSETSDFPTTDGSTLKTVSDAVVAKFNSSGSLQWSTLLGGNGWDTADCIAVDSAGKIWVGGTTHSSNFPVPGGFQTTRSGSADAFLVSFNSSSPSVTWGTYLGGSSGGASYPSAESGEAVRKIAFDPDGRMWVAGVTVSTDFPLVNAFDTSANGSYDVFVAKLTNSPTATRLAMSSYLGGPSLDRAWGLGVDAGFNVWVAGETDSSTFPVPGGHDTTYGGARDAFLTRISKPAISVQVTAANASETGPTVGTVTMTRTGTGTQPLSVAVRAGGTAFVNDYNPLLWGYVTFGATEMSRAVDITPVNDAVVEGTESLTIRLRPSANYGAPGPFNPISIFDND